ncbi:MAG: DsbA family oxidoreductase [Ideonella sp. WA131b]|jgi:predicted DsbA family dithiol-disulfide isomerase|nr:DsbA family oxidoreductase [Ideonella sp. WA131b]
MRIDFISDVACPWCAIGLASLEQALAALGPEAEAIELHFQPFELNPQMPPEGADAAAYLKAKYGLGDAQLAANRENIRARGAALGFAFGERAHVWNTFDAHRLLHWAGLQGPAPQRAMKRALLQAYHGEGRNPAAREVLLEAAGAAGLDATEAAAVIDDRDCFAPEVREAESDWQAAGIRSVPSVVLDRRFLIQGGQPPEVFEDALRRRLAAAD